VAVSKHVLEAAGAFGRTVSESQNAQVRYC
jgi:hypothetical protein